MEGLTYVEEDLIQSKGHQIVTEVVLSTMKSKEFCVRPKVPLEDKVYLEAYYHHSQDDIQVDGTSAKI
jgi:hypothetical protein